MLTHTPLAGLHASFHSNSIEPRPLQPPHTCATPSLLQAYVPAFKGVEFSTAEPQLFPDVGIWHPLAPSMYEDLKEYLNW